VSCTFKWERFVAYRTEAALPTQEGIHDV